MCSRRDAHVGLFVASCSVSGAAFAPAGPSRPRLSDTPTHTPKQHNNTNKHDQTAALVFVGGGAFALTSVDAGFAEFMRTAAVKVRRFLFFLAACARIDAVGSSAACSSVEERVTYL